MDVNYNNEYTNKLKLKNIYLARIKFEDGYDKKIGTDFKVRPVLILDKFFDKKTKSTSFIVAPIYSIKTPTKKFKFDYVIHNWKNIFQKNNTHNYKAKFKLSQIQIINKTSFTKKIIKGIYLYKKMEINSPLNNYDYEKLNKKIHKYYYSKEINEAPNNTKEILKIYINKSHKRKEKNYHYDYSF